MEMEMLFGAKMDGKAKKTRREKKWESNGAGKVQEPAIALGTITTGENDSIGEQSFGACWRKKERS